MIVRLKGYILTIQPLHFEMFQFYDSPIKSFVHLVGLPILWGFNSMIVRLKAAMPFALYGDYTQVSIL